MTIEYSFGYHTLSNRVNRRFFRFAVIVGIWIANFRESRVIEGQRVKKNSRGIHAL